MSEAEQIQTISSFFAGREQGRTAAVPFAAALARSLDRRAMRAEDLLGGIEANLAWRVLCDYGALFVATPEVAIPPVCVFTNEREVALFQERAGRAREDFSGSVIELQPAAMTALLAARDEARSEGLDVTPRGGAEAARRTYADTLRLWDSRFTPALAYWAERGRLTSDEVCRYGGQDVARQITTVLSLEERGIFFSRDFSKSVFYSVAPPGASQHLSMLALDVAEFGDKCVRAILARHGWYQTVQSDLPHFTYLGRRESDLPEWGLRAIEADGRRFWIPNIEA